MLIKTLNSNYELSNLYSNNNSALAALLSCSAAATPAALRLLLSPSPPPPHPPPTRARAAGRRAPARGDVHRTIVDRGSWHQSQPCGQLQPRCLRLPPQWPRVPRWWAESQRRGSNRCAPVLCYESSHRCAPVLHGDNTALHSCFPFAAAPAPAVVVLRPFFSLAACPVVPRAGHEPPSSAASHPPPHPPQCLRRQSPIPNRSPSCLLA
jgi:hypothetical protein